MFDWEYVCLCQVIRHYHGHLSAVYDLDLHPTIDVLVTCSRDSTARVRLPLSLVSQNDVFKSPKKIHSWPGCLILCFLRLSNGVDCLFHF